MLACFYWAKSQSHDFKNHIIAFYTQKKHEMAKFHENWTIRFLKRPGPRQRYSKKC